MQYSFWTFASSSLRQYICIVLVTNFVTFCFRSKKKTSTLVSWVLCTHNFGCVLGNDIQKKIKNVRLEVILDNQLVHYRTWWHAWSQCKILQWFYSLWCKKKYIYKFLSFLLLFLNCHLNVKNIGNLSRYIAIILKWEYFLIFSDDICCFVVWSLSFLAIWDLDFFMTNIFIFYHEIVALSSPGFSVHNECSRPQSEWAVSNKKSTI